MKRCLILPALLLACGAAVAADETVEVYRAIYLQAEGLAQKSAAVQDLVRLEDRETAPILADALAELLRLQESYSSPRDHELYSRTLAALAAALGDYKHIEAAPNLWSVVEQVADPVARAEALTALGKMRALGYAERVALLLRDLNLKPTADPAAGEKVAFGAVVALEKLRDARGFAPVFFATDAWYSPRVKQQAERSLPRIVDDPTDAIVKILREESPERMLKALKAELASKAAAARKAQAAIVALDLGHRQVGRDKLESIAYSELRKLALRALASSRASGPESVAGCVASYERGVDDEEKLLGLAALGANGSDPASAALKAIILKLNEEQRSGVASDTRNRMVRAAIENAALSKNSMLKPALLLVANNDKWSGGIIAAAQAAQAAIP